MTVEIKTSPYNDSVIHVNGKAVLEDMEGKWNSDEEFSPSEEKFTVEFLNTWQAIGRNKQLKATYTI